jgi:HD-GYP domain-containing protein (c-di-GMP phosphodiesterase class II)
MFSILDILKKHREDKKKQDASGAEPQACPQSVLFGEDTRVAPAVSVFAAVDKDVLEQNLRQMAQLYDEAVCLLRKLYAVGGVDVSVIKNELDPLVARLVAQITGGNRASQQLFFAEYASLKDYLYYHAANVCLLSLELGMALKLEPPALGDLAKTALLHDIGMVSVATLMMKPGPLNNEEIAKVRLHPKAGTELLAKISREFPRFVTDTVAQEHERFDGSGYPKGQKSDDISEFARIIGLVDVYEAMTHSRPHRIAYTPSATVNAILNGKGSFDSRLIKALIERIGIFPEGTKVRLNTKETGIVIKVNPLSPLRPVVSVITDSQGNELKAFKEINLDKDYLIHIEENLGK